MSKDRQYFSIRQLMPYPIASSWHRVELAVTDSDRVGRLLFELSKEQNLFRHDDARFVLVSHPKTHANIVLKHIHFLKSHHLRKLVQSKDTNQVAQNIAQKLLSTRQ